jgi:hypothetical protein
MARTATSGSAEHEHGCKFSPKRSGGASTNAIVPGPLADRSLGCASVREVPGGLGEAEKVLGEAVLRAENFHADEATFFEVEDDLRKVVLVIERNRNRDPPG